ncbi:MAG: threonine dehydratase [Arenicella sp.]|jgi:threonine dehydratase
MHNMETLIGLPTLKGVNKAVETLKGVSTFTPLYESSFLSEKFDCKVQLKREDLQVGRSYKLRGAFNKISSLSKDEMSKGIVCASAGNHAQGVAFSCQKLNTHGLIFMPTTTPKQKVDAVRRFGGEFVQIELKGDTFDDAYSEAMATSIREEKVFVHPFDDVHIIEGQATVGLEVLSQSKDPIDYLIIPVGGGGLAAGLVTVFKEISPDTKIIAIEPKGAPSMTLALKEGYNAELETIEKFVDGAAVKKVGSLTFDVCKNHLNKVLTVESGKICQTMIDLYNLEAIIAEPAGALSIASLDQLKSQLKGKNVVCILSGGNNDISRMEDIKERAAIYSGEKHYFLVQFPQRSGALKEFVLDVLGESDDIFHFEYLKKHARTYGSAVVGIDVSSQKNYEELEERMIQKGFFKEYLNDNSALMDVLV